MSEKRSWDIQPNKRPTAQAAPRITTPPPVRTASRTSSPVRRVTPARQRPVPPPARRRPQPLAGKPVIRRERVVQGKDREPLKKRRRRARNRSLLIILILLILAIVGGFVCLWLPAFRVRTVNAAGPDATAIQSSVLSSLGGSYHYVVPRDSIFFFPEQDIRTQILQQYPDIAAVSISRTSLDSIAVDTIPRESAFIWCGQTYAPLSTAAQVVISTSSVPTTTPPPACYNADAQGYIFSPIDAQTDPSQSLRVYGPLASETASGTPVIGQRVSEASFIPNALKFVKAIKSLGVTVVALALRSDEADLYTQGNTRITYVLGQEAQAASLAQSAFPSLNLNNGTLSYVDLRFAGKVYFKNVGAGNESSTTSTH